MDSAAVTGDMGDNRPVARGSSERDTWNKRSALEEGSERVGWRSVKVGGVGRLERPVEVERMYV